MTVRFRAARPDDIALMRRWDAAPHIVAAKGTEDWEWESELARSDDCAVYRLSREGWTR